MNIAFGMIVFNGDYVLQQCLESVYPYASQILVAEGPVQFWQDQGYSTSTDATNDILNEFYDPDEKLTVIHKKYSEKNEQCNTYIPFMRNDTDYLWNLDSDEIFKPEDIETIMALLEVHDFTSVGFRSTSFYGGFDHYLTGFEEGAEFIRIQKVYEGSYWGTHRPPTIAHKVTPRLPARHLSFDQLDSIYGVRMFHYSYVFPFQVKQKVKYYKQAVSKDNCIDDYFEEVYLPWVTEPFRREEIEQRYEGVHEFKPHVRGWCLPKPFNGTHPAVIRDAMPELKKKFDKQLLQVQV